MSTGSVRSCPPSCGASVTSVTSRNPYLKRWKQLTPGGPAASDVQEPDVLGVAGDERAAGLDVLAHQHAEQLIGLGRVIQGHLQQDPAGRVHRGFPQLVGVHLAQALEPLYAVPRPRVLPAS